jgi:hypothetical protein
MAITVAEIDVADPPDAWKRAGFIVDSDDVCRIGGVDIRRVVAARAAGRLAQGHRRHPHDEVRRAPLDAGRPP